MIRMSDDLNELLARCLARLAAGDDFDACLRDAGPRATELRPLLESAASLRSVPVEPYSPEAFHAGKTRLRATLADRAHRRRPAYIAPLWRSAIFLAAAAAVAVVALLAFSTDLFRFGSTGTQAQVQGVLSSVQDGTLVITTLDGEVRIALRDTTRVVDPQGQAQAPEGIPPGQNVLVDVQDDGGAFTATRVEIEREDEEHEGAPGPEVKVEFSGSVTAVNGGDITVQAPFGTALVHLTDKTEVRGNIAPGAEVEVHATRQPDGSYVAKEIEAIKGGGDGGDDHPEGSGGSDGGEGGD